MRVRLRHLRHQLMWMVACGNPTQINSKSTRKTENSRATKGRGNLGQTRFVRGKPSR